MNLISEWTRITSTKSNNGSFEKYLFPKSLEPKIIIVAYDQRLNDLSTTSRDEYISGLIYATEYGIRLVAIFLLFLA